MKIKFIPNNIEVEIKPNESVLKVAQDNGIHIKSVCKGVPSCAECRIQIAEGEHNVFKPTPTELSLIGTAQFVDRSRLACQLKCFGDVTIDLHEQIEKASRVLSNKKPRGLQAGDDYDPGHSYAIRGNVILDEPAPENPIPEPRTNPVQKSHHRPDKNRRR